jgi:polyisoprenoid-binding protein YceI
MNRLILAATIFLSLPAFAAPVTYVLDHDHTYPSFEVGHMGYSFFRGVFKTTSGKATLDTAAKTGSLEVRIDTPSIDMGSGELVKHLKSDEFFDVEKYPAMTYKSGKFNFEGEKVASIDGELTLLGVTKPVTLNVDHFKCGPHPMMKKPMCGANATASIKRSDFGMKIYVPLVSDEVKITIQVEALSE